MTRAFRLLSAAVIVAVSLASAPGAQAQTTSALVVSTCNAQSYSVGTNRQVTMDQTGKLCDSGGSGGGVGGSVVTTPGQRTLVTLDVKTVTTGATAVTAIAAGHRTAGGFLTNPKAATVDLCINEIGVAAGTTSSGDTTCIPPGASYNVAPAAGGVSVVTSDSSHPFSGYGMQ